MTWHSVWPQTSKTCLQKGFFTTEKGLRIWRHLVVKVQAAGSDNPSILIKLANLLWPSRSNQSGLNKQIHRILLHRPRVVISDLFIKVKAATLKTNTKQVVLERWVWLISSSCHVTIVAVAWLTRMDPKLEHQVLLPAGAMLLSVDESHRYWRER